MDLVKGKYSSEAARRRFFRDYFDFSSWIRSQPIENLQYLTRQFVQTYCTHRDFDTLFRGIEWWSDDLSPRTCKQVIKIVLHRKSEYALRNMLLLWSDYTLDDMVRVLKHSDQRVDDDTMRARCAAAQPEARLVQRKPTRGRPREAARGRRASKKQRRLTDEEEERLDHLCLHDELGKHPDFQRCDKHPRCVLKPHGNCVKCKLLEVGDRFRMVFFGPPRSGTYDIYEGKVLEFLYYGKRVKAEFSDETCTASLNNYWYAVPNK